MNHWNSQKSAIPRCFSKQAVLKILQSSQEKTCCGFFFKKLFVFKRDSNSGVSCGYCEIFKNSFFIKNLWWLLLKVLPQYSKVGCGICSLNCAFTCFWIWLKIYTKHCTNNSLLSSDKTISFLLELIYHVLSISEYVLEKYLLLSTLMENLQKVLHK